MINIIGFTKSELWNYIHSEEYKNSLVLPISYHRAQSHIQNPSASETDYLLFLAKENEQLVGYIGVLPVEYTDGESIKKAGFLSCLWIDPNKRGRKIAQQLLNKAYETWNGAIFVTEFTPEAKMLYDKSTYFQDLVELEGLRTYIKFDLQRILPPKKKIFQSLKPVLGFVDLIANGITSPFRIVKVKKKYSHQLSKIDTVTDEVDRFIQHHFDKQQLFKRSASALNWIHDYPWIKNVEDDDGSARKYYFSSVAQRFLNLQFIFKNSQNQVVAYLMFSIRDSHLKTCYCYFDESSGDDVFHLIHNLIVEYDIKTFTTFNKSLIKLSKFKSFEGIFKKQIKRKYIVSKTIQLDTNHVLIMDGDADCCFT